MSVRPSALTSIRASLPKGGRLPAEVWSRRHTGIVMLLWAHAVVIPIFGVIRGFVPTHAIAEGGIVTAAAVFASMPMLTRVMRTGASSVGLLSASAILVHMSGGVIEMHFHFFVMVAVIALYQDWLPFLAAVGYVFIHHGVMGAVDPESVYNHYAAWNNPWKWASIHALFILGISGVCLTTWQLNERALQQRTDALDRLREETKVVETLHQIGQVLAAELDSQRVVQTVTDAATSLSGADFGAFFYNVYDDAGGAYMLYSLSGAPASAFENFGLPRATPVFGPTFAGEGVIRLDDVRADPRYGRWGPHHGMPPGHLPVVSYLAVPVKTRDGEVLGGLFFGHKEPGMFDEVDERIVTGIAAQAAIALDNARLYDRQRTVAETLQHSLLPERLPSIPGLAAAARYSAGGPDVEVGGDWYDVVLLSGGRVAIAMGDVVGRGEKAAALMGQLRAGLRAYAIDGKGPSEILAGLNHLLIDAGRDHMATAIVAVLDPQRLELHIANAGHPPPVLRTGGSVETLDGAGGVPLGALPGALYRETVVVLPVESTLVLYTDGLVERRGRSLDEGFARFLAATRDGPADPDALCDELLTLGGEDRHDDAAVLAVHVVRLGTHLRLHLQGDPGSLVTLRATLRRWFAEVGVPDAEAYDLLVVAGELASNAIRHPAVHGPGFDFEAIAEDGTIELVVRDSGTWRAPRPESTGGRGLGIVENLVDDLRFERGERGTTVRATRRITAAAGVGETV